MAVVIGPSCGPRLPRTFPHGENGGMERLDIAMLGRFAVTVDGRAVDAFAHRRAADLVKLLALAPAHRLTRDRVVETLWPSLPADSGLANLHKAAHHARRALGDRRAVVLRKGLVELAPGAAVATDVERFEAGDDSAYAGPLLPDDAYDDWSVADRDRLQALYGERLRRQGRWEELLAVDPADEQAHRELLRRALAAGDRLAAARRLRALRDALSPLGLQPSAETLELAHDIAAGPPARVSLPADDALIGRRAEFAAATRALQRATAGHGATLVVTGDAGIGKTRFVDEVIAAAQRRGWHTLRGVAHGEHAGIPYRPLAEALDLLLAERPDLVAGLAPGSRSALARLSPAVEAEAAAPVERHALLAAVAQLVRAAGRERGLLLALEDLHAADAASLQVVDFLATTARAEPVIVLVSARPTGETHAFAELAATLRRHGTGTEIALGPLAGDEIRCLAARAATHPLSDAALAAVERAAAGNPFYAEQLAAAGGARVPDHVQSALDARLDLVAPELLPALAVADDGFSAEEIAAIAGGAEAEVAAGLAAATDEGVLRGGPGGWSFRHPLLREAAVRRATPAALAAAHARAAERLAATGAAPERVAHHRLAAGDGQAAVPLLAEAARRAAAVGAYADGRR
jgi:DNA-binding SARP family transcriptional activator